MAVMKNSGDRRAFLAAGMGTIVAVGVAPVAFATTIAPATNRTAWDAAMAEYVAAKAAMDAADATGDDEVVGQFIDAEQAILDTRTPDMRAFRWKVERMRDISEHSVIDEEDFDRLLADLRLLGDA